MVEKLRKKFERLEQQRSRLFEALSHISHDSLNLKPSPDKWSIAQILSHLINAETNSQLYIDKKITYVDTTQSAGIKGWLRMMMMRIAFRLPVKYKAPAFVSVVPETATMAELDTKWSNVRIKMKATLERITPAMMDKELFKQPFAGKMNASHALDFMQSHYSLHEKQVKKLMQHQ